MTTARQILYLEPVLIVCQGQQAHLHGVLDFETAVTCDLPGLLWYPHRSRAYPAHPSL